MVDPGTPYFKLFAMAGPMFEPGIPVQSWPDPSARMIEPGMPVQSWPARPVDLLYLAAGMAAAWAVWKAGEALVRLGKRRLWPRIKRDRAG